jgi:hypothetical protein
LADSTCDALEATDADWHDLVSAIRQLDLTTLDPADLEWVAELLLDALATNDPLAASADAVLLLQQVIDEMVRRTRDARDPSSSRRQSIGALGRVGRKLGTLPVLEHGINLRAVVDNFRDLLGRDHHES